MMFVFGEVADPLQDTTLLVEDIVRSQVIELVSKGHGVIHVEEGSRLIGVL